MQVNPDGNTLGAGQARVVRAKAAETRAVSATSESGNAAKLRQALRQTPPVRAEKVARAKKLVASSSYPSNQVLDQVATVLARHINTQDTSR